MTVPPNYGPPPEQPHTPGYGYQSPYSGGQNPYGSQPQQPSYGGGGGGQQPPYGGGGQPPYGQDPGSPYGGPVLPPEPPKRNLGLVGGVIVGATVIVLGAVLLVTLNLQGKDKDDDTAEGGGTTESASANENTPEADATTPAEETDSEVGQCLPYESEVDGSGLGPLVPCSDATAFWEIKAQSYDVLDIAVDGEGSVTDTAPIYAMCGDGWGTNVLGKAWTKWDYVYSSGTLDSLYCLQAVGNPDPAEPDHLPIMPDVGDCFDDSSSWWSIDCGSDLALYTVVDTIMFDEPVADMSDEDADEEGTKCGTDWYWRMLDGEGRTYGVLCGNDV